MINTALEAKPADMAITTHVCRGNFRSTWISEGGYEPVAEMPARPVNYDGYFLEYDTDRAGGFEPLRFLPKGNKQVVLGLVTSKSGALERRTTSSGASTRPRNSRRSSSSACRRNAASPRPRRATSSPRRSNGQSLRMIVDIAGRSVGVVPLLSSPRRAGTAIARRTSNQLNLVGFRRRWPRVPAAGAAHEKCARCVLLPTIPGRLLSPAGLADRPGRALETDAAAGARQRPLASRRPDARGRTGRRHADRHPRRRSAPASTWSPTASSGARASSNRFATALAGTTSTIRAAPRTAPAVFRSCRGWSGRIRRRHPVADTSDVAFLRANTERMIKMTVPGPFTMSQQCQDDFYGDGERLRRSDYAAAAVMLLGEHYALPATHKTPVRCHKYTPQHWRDPFFEGRQSAGQFRHASTICISKQMQAARWPVMSWSLRPACRQRVRRVSAFGKLPSSSLVRFKHQMALDDNADGKARPDREEVG